MIIQFIIIIFKFFKQDNGELGSPGGHSQPQLNQENPNSNHSQHAYSENSGPPVVNTPSLPQMVPSSFNTTVVGGTQPYPPSMVTFFDIASLYYQLELNYYFLNNQNLKQSVCSSFQCSNSKFKANKFDIV